MQSEQEKFLEDTEIKPEQVDVLEQPLTETKPEEGGEPKQEEDGENTKPRNRRERRLMERLDAERQSSAFLAGKLEARTEAEHSLSEESDYLKGLERIYGTETPEAQLATDLLKKAIIGAREDAHQSALEEFRNERQRETAEIQAADRELDDMINEIEDEYGVNLTDSQQRSFYQLLEKMSPKDSDGDVIEYADPHAVWDVLQDRIKRRPAADTSQAKDLSSRSMVQSGASRESTLQDDATLRFLKDNGIL